MPVRRSARVFCFLPLPPRGGSQIDYVDGEVLIDMLNSSLGPEELRPSMTTFEIRENYNNLFHFRLSDG